MRNSLFLAPVPPNDNCCQKITLSSQGGVQVHYSEALGDYAVESTDDNGKPIFRHKTNLISVYLHHTSDQEHNWSGWQFTRDVSDVFGFISNENEDSCPSGKLKPKYTKVWGPKNKCGGLSLHIKALL